MLVLMHLLYCSYKKSVKNGVMLRKGIAKLFSAPAYRKGGSGLDSWPGALFFAEKRRIRYTEPYQ
jgi:hypothetical protein